MRKFERSIRADIEKAKCEFFFVYIWSYYGNSRHRGG
jgi:hypothetical protein